MKKKDYEEYLKSEKWNEKRKAKLWLSEYTCELCNSKNVKLHVHHRTYANIEEEKPKDLIVLCETCHQRFHGKSQEKEPTTQEFRDLNSRMTIDKIINSFIPDMRKEAMPDKEIADALLSLWLGAGLSYYDIILKMSEVDKVTGLWNFDKGNINK